MIDRVFGDMGAALTGVVEGAAVTSLIVMAAAILFKGLRTRTLLGVFGRAAAALMLMLALLYVVYGFMPATRFSLAGWAAHTEASWNTVMTTTGLTMMGYYLVALVGVAIVFAVKSLLHRHD